MNLQKLPSGEQWRTRQWKILHVQNVKFVCRLFKPAITLAYQEATLSLVWFESNKTSPIKWAAFAASRVLVRDQQDTIVPARGHCLRGFQAKTQQRQNRNQVWFLIDNMALSENKEPLALNKFINHCFPFDQCYFGVFLELYPIFNHLTNPYLLLGCFYRSSLSQAIFKVTHSDNSQEVCKLIQLRHVWKTLVGTCFIFATNPIQCFQSFINRRCSSCWKRNSFPETAQT